MGTRSNRRHRRFPDRYRVVTRAAAATVVLVVAAGYSGGSRGDPSPGRPLGRAWTGAAAQASVPVGVASTRSGQGFWVASADGAVTPEGDAVSYGDVSNLPLVAPVVSIGATGTGHGYWLLGGDGGVFAFGDAGYYGSMGGRPLNQQPLQLVGNPAGGGYWFVARDGGVFSFGDTGFYGSMGGRPLNEPVVGMAATPSGRGYWLVARDGGIFSFGDAGFYGSMGGRPLNEPVVGMAATPSGRGYWLVARDGGIFSFGDAGFYGSAGGSPSSAPIIGMTSSAGGAGYWLDLGNGQVRAFGDAAALSTAPLATSGYSLVGQVVAIDPGHNGGNGSDPGYINRPVWNGRSFESCDTTGTETAGGYTEASFNFDVASRLAALVRSYGATVVLTRDNNTGVGPCVDQRAAIGNDASADVMLDIHADGGPVTGRGFTVLEPVADGPNSAVIGASSLLAVDTRDVFGAITAEPVSNYDGVDGIQPRADLAGLNLTTVPKVLIECANMRNPTDAAEIGDPAWRQNAAAALAESASQFLIGFR